MGSWILVVDDDDDIREILTLLLENAGYSVDSAGDGIEAWDKMTQRGPPALMLLDLRMPRMSGGELLERMRRTPALASTAIVIISGDSEGIQQCDVPGVRAWLRKPIELSDLIGAVERCVPSAHATP